MTALWIVLAALAAGTIGAFAGFQYRKNVMEAKIGRTEAYAKNLLEEAQHRAEENKKEKILEAKEEVLKIKNELDREIRDRRAEMTRSERRLMQHSLPGSTGLILVWGLPAKPRSTKRKKRSTNSTGRPSRSLNPSRPSSSASPA